MFNYKNMYVERKHFVREFQNHFGIFRNDIVRQGAPIKKIVRRN